ncbi:MAG: phosphoribosyltransferase family protein [Thermoplasmata archaeon]
MEQLYATKDEVERAWDILQSAGALKQGHFLLPQTGLHYEHFFQVPLALQHSRDAKILCVALGRVLRRSGILHRLDRSRRFTILAPMDAGIPVAFWTGEHLSADRILWVNRANKGWKFRPFIGIDKDDQVIIVDDAILTGGTISSVVKFVRSRGSSIVAIATIVDRRDETPSFDGIPVYCLIHEKGKKHKPEECPLCEKGLELVKIAPPG